MPEPVNNAPVKPVNLDNPAPEQTPVDKKVNTCIVALFGIIGLGLLSAGGYFLFKSFYHSDILSHRSITLLRGVGGALSGLGIILCACGIREYGKGAASQQQDPGPRTEGLLNAEEEQSRKAQQALEKQQQEEKAAREKIRASLLKAVSAHKVEFKTDKIDMALGELATLTLDECPIEKRIELYKAIFKAKGITDDQKVVVLNAIASYSNHDGVPAFLEEQVTYAILKTINTEHQGNVFGILSQVKKEAFVVASVQDLDGFLQLAPRVKAEIYSMMTSDQLMPLFPRLHAMNLLDECIVILESRKEYNNDFFQVSEKIRKDIYSRMSDAQCETFIAKLNVETQDHRTEVLKILLSAKNYPLEDMFHRFINAGAEARNYAGVKFAAEVINFWNRGNASDILKHLSQFYPVVHRMGAEAERAFVQLIAQNVHIVRYIKERSIDGGANMTLVVDGAEKKEDIKNYFRKKMPEVTDDKDIVALLQRLEQSQQ